MKAARQPLSIGCILASEFTLSDFARFVDYVSFASLRARQSVICSIMNHDGSRIRASCDVRVSADSRFVDPSSFDYVVVIGGVPQRGEWIEETTAAYLAEAAMSGVTLVGLCAGSFILCRLGLMRDRTCCVHPRHRQSFVKAFPNVRVVSDRRFLIDENRITCGGGAATPYLAAYLLTGEPGGSTVQKAGNVALVEGMPL